jgi:hypothetical protein
MNTETISNHKASAENFYSPCSCEISSYKTNTKSSSRSHQWSGTVEISDKPDYYLIDRTVETSSTPPVSIEQKLLKEINAILYPDATVDLFEKCFLKQQAYYIVQYGMDMIRDGSKMEWVAQVCAGMAILYQKNIETYIPDEISIEKNQSPEDINQSMQDQKGIVFNPQFVKQRADAIVTLTEIMADYGVDYGIVSDYLKAQRYDSWDKLCCVMKYFLLQQQENMEKSVDAYYLGDHGAGPYRQIFGIDKLREIFNEQIPTQDELDTYTKAVAMYKAYTAIALGKTKFNNKNLTNRTCIVQRSMNRQTLVSGYEGYDKVVLGGKFNGMKGGIADSTALGSPTFFFIRKRNDIHEMTIPFSRIHAMYFISSELCYDDEQESKNNTDIGFGGGHEFVCDLHGLQVTLIKLGRMKSL